MTADTTDQKVRDHGLYTITDDDLFTSDTHFYHKNVIEYCDRPFCCVHSMNEYLIKRWNEQVKENQRVFVLGDFAFGGTKLKECVLYRLNGYKVLVKGNHDPGRNKMVKCGFDEAVLTAEATYNGAKDGAKTVFMRHIPAHDLAQKYDYHLCGHVHEKWCRVENIINVGVDIWDLMPVGFKDLIDNSIDIQHQITKNQGRPPGASDVNEERDTELVERMYNRNK